MKRFPLLMVTWTVLLVAGFALVFALGQPLPSPADELAAARTPATPVSQETAERSAATIVRLEYPQYQGSKRTVERRSDFGIDRWLIVYTDPATAGGVRISINVSTGAVEVSTFP